MSGLNFANAKAYQDWVAGLDVPEAQKADLLRQGGVAGTDEKKPDLPLKWTNKCILYERDGVMYTSRMCFSIQTPGGEPFHYEDVCAIKPRPKRERKDSSWWSTPFSPR